MVRPVRHAVLRAGKPFETTIWPDDDAPETAHFGCFAGEALVGVASLYLQAPEGYSGDAEAWQLRGMAVLEAERKKGYGRQLLAACIQYVHARKHALLWCNARVTATEFYARNGFQQEGESFEIPGIGPHCRMILT